MYVTALWKSRKNLTLLKKNKKNWGELDLAQPWLCTSPWPRASQGARGDRGRERAEARPPPRAPLRGHQVGAGRDPQVCGFAPCERRRGAAQVCKDQRGPRFIKKRAGRTSAPKGREELSTVLAATREAAFRQDHYTAPVPLCVVINFFRNKTKQNKKESEKLWDKNGLLRCLTFFPSINDSSECSF